MPRDPERTIYLRPQGPQGPKISIGISGEEDLRRLDEEVGRLTEDERNSYKGLSHAAEKAGLRQVES